MIFESLKFDTPNNAAISLRFLAEYVRRGEIKATVKSDVTIIPGRGDRVSRDILTVCLESPAR